MTGNIITAVKENLKWPWLVTVPLLVIGYICSVFFIGTDSPLLAPAIIILLAISVIGHWPNLKEGWHIPNNYTFLFAILFWIWVVASIFWSTIPYVSTTFALIISILPLFFAVCITAHNPEKWTKIHAGTIWFALALFAFWALIQFFFLYEQYGPRIRHPMLNPNNLAGVFNMGLFPAMAMFFLAKDKKWSVLSGIMLAVFYAALIVTQSRGGLYACIACVLVFLPIAAFKNPNGIPWVKLILVIIGAVCIPAIGNIYNPGSLAENLVSAEAFTNTRSLEDRFYLWESTLKMVKEHPWLGTGLASFYFYYPRYRFELDRSDGFFSHMDPLQFWAEMGFMAPVLFYGVLICVLIRTIKAVKAAGPDMQKRLSIIGPFCGMLALTGHTHLTFHLYMPGILIPLSLFLAYWYMMTEKALGDAGERKLFKPQGNMRIATLTGLGALVILSGGWIARTSAATLMMTKVQEAVNAGDQQKAERRLSWAGIIAPNSFGRTYEYEARFRISKIWAQGNNMPRDELEKLYKEAVYYLDETEKRNPAFTAIWDLRGKLYIAVDGAIMPDGYAKGVDLLNKVVEANPMSADTRVTLANLYASRGDIARAVYILESGMKWPRPKGVTDLNFLLTIARLKLQQGDQNAHDVYFAEAQRRAKSYGMVIQAPPAQQ